MVCYEHAVHCTPPIDRSIRLAKSTGTRESNNNSPRSGNLDADGSSGELAPAFGTPILSSVKTAWEGIRVEAHRLPPFEMPEVRIDQHLICIHLSTPITLEWLENGRFQSRRMLPGDIGITPIGVKPKARWKESAEYLMMFLDSAFVAHAVRDLVNAENIELVPQHGGIDPQILHIGLALQAEIEAGAHCGRLYGESLATALAVHLLRRYSVRKQNLPEYFGGLSKQNLQCAIEFIHENLEKNLTLEQIADSVHLSVYHFARGFKQSTGLTPYQYVLERRVERAKGLLLKNKLSLTQVAHRVGFADASHLTRHFKRLTGYTPGIFRKR